MDVKEKLLLETLSEKFNINKYVTFMAALLNTMKITTSKKHIDIANQYKSIIKSYNIVGRYEDNNKEKLLILAVEIAENKKVNNSRSIQRNFVANILKDSDYDAALVAFYSDEEKIWRLSFVKMEYIFEHNGVEVQFTPVKRYSYVLGEGEELHTVVNQLKQLILNDKENPSIKEIQNKFSVEPVTVAFFDEYQEKYYELLDAIELRQLTIFDADEWKQRFSKKLLGQIVFLYFLQKKGWLGVGKEQQWGTGDKNFIRKQFDKYNHDNKNFYSEFLVPMFEELNNDSRILYSKLFDSRIPFLNGELFETLDEGNVFINNSYFSNENDTGFLDILGKYNFTVYENDPTEIEVGIDPEMLGEIFQRLLNRNERKKTASFYTPKEIVHFMCCECLLNYLDKNLEDDRDYIKIFLEHCKYGIGIESYTIKFQESVLKALYSVKVLDPSVGSGAFAVGMLMEIVKIKSVLLPMENMYTLKLETIHNCIFGLDIQPTAVDITKLRLNLALIVDEKCSNNNPEPLPNLNCNICCGNSLISEFGTVDIDLIDTPKNQINRLIYLQNELFSIRNRDEKKDIKKQIANSIEEVVNKKIGSSYFFDDNMKNCGASKTFSYYMNFPKVFSEHNGFDIVIGNPPYGILNKKQNKSESVIASDTEMEIFKTKKVYQPAKGRGINIYQLFICKGFELLKEKGTMSLIFPMAFMCDLSAGNLRKYLLYNGKIDYFEAFPERDNPKKRVFEDAKMSVCILGVTKEKNSNEAIKLRIHSDRFVDEENEKVYLGRKQIEAIDGKYYTIPLVSAAEYKILSKISKNPVSLGKISKCWTGEVDMSIDKEYIRNCGEYPTLIRGAQVQRYSIVNTISQGELIYLDSKQYLFNKTGGKSVHYQKRRIVMQGITGVNEKNRLKMAIVESGTFCANSVNYILEDDTKGYSLEYLLGILNSKLLNWFFKKLSTNSNVNGYEVDNLPIVLDKKRENELVELVKRRNNTNHVELDESINELVYKVYGLDYSEIKLIEQEM